MKSDLALFKPELYRYNGTASRPHNPALIGGRCGSCSYVYFPFRSYGCERCGSGDLAMLELAGHGRLVAAVEVHFHPAADRNAPFTIGTIALDDGPVIRTLLLAGDRFITGDPVVAVLAPVRVGDAEMLDLRFAAER